MQRRDFTTEGEKAGGFPLPLHLAYPRPPFSLTRQGGRRSVCRFKENERRSDTMDSNSDIIKLWKEASSCIVLSKVGDATCLPTLLKTEQEDEVRENTREEKQPNYSRAAILNPDHAELDPSCLQSIMKLRSRKCVQIF
eukprot:759801-Hanusia_phi.AAC.1